MGRSALGAGQVVWAAVVRAGVGVADTLGPASVVALQDWVAMGLDPVDPVVAWMGAGMGTGTAKGTKEKDWG